MISSHKYSVLREIMWVFVQRYKDTNSYLDNIGSKNLSTHIKTSQTKYICLIYCNKCQKLIKGNLIFDEEKFSKEFRRASLICAHSNHLKCANITCILNGLNDDFWCRFELKLRQNCICEANKTHVNGFRNSILP